MTEKTIAALESELNQARVHLETARTMPPKGIEGTLNDYNQARANGADNQTLASLYERHEFIKGAHSMAIGKLEGTVKLLTAKLEEMRAQERQRENQSASEKEAILKQKVFGGWIASGGTEVDFEAAWPEIKRKYLIQQALDGLQAETSRYPIPGI